MGGKYKNVLTITFLSFLFIFFSSSTIVKADQNSNSNLKNVQSVQQNVSATVDTKSNSNGSANGTNSVKNSNDTNSANGINSSTNSDNVSNNTKGTNNSSNTNSTNGANSSNVSNNTNSVKGTSSTNGANNSNNNSDSNLGFDEFYKNIKDEEAKSPNPYIDNSTFASIYGVSYGTHIRSKGSAADNSGIVDVDDFEYALLAENAKYNLLSQEEDWQKKIDPLGAYYAHLLNSYVNKWSVIVPANHIDESTKIFNDAVKKYKLSQDYLNFENFSDQSFFPKYVSGSVSYALNNPIYMTYQLKSANTNFAPSDYKPTDTLLIKGITVRNTTGHVNHGLFDFYGMITKDNETSVSLHDASLKDFAGLYEGPIYMVNVEDISNSSRKVFAIPLDYLLFLSPKVVDGSGNVYSDSLDNVPVNINFVDNSKLISKQTITMPYNNKIYLSESDLNLPDGYEIAPFQKLDFTSLDEKFDFNVEVRPKQSSDSDSSKAGTSAVSSSNDDKTTSKGNDAKDTSLVDKVGSAIVQAGSDFGNAISNVADALTSTFKSCVNYIKDTYKKTKDSASYSIQSMVNDFFNSSGNFYKTILNKQEIDAIGDFKQVYDVVKEKKSLKDVFSAKTLGEGLDKILNYKTIWKDVYKSSKMTSKDLIRFYGDLKDVVNPLKISINELLNKVHDDSKMTSELTAIKESLKEKIQEFNKFNPLFKKDNKVIKESYRISRDMYELNEVVNKSVKIIKKDVDKLLGENNQEVLAIRRHGGVLTIITPWGNIDYNYHVILDNNTFYNTLKVAKNVILNLVKTGVDVVNNYVDNFAKEMLLDVPYGTIAAVALYAIPFIFNNYITKAEEAISATIYDKLNNKRFTDKDVADNINILK
ncbi:hypothetical protein RZ77_08360 [Apilactobacillus kunkeei]|uniref:hypothetical protein n=1 Tax=Apilactobacillus kunkeei TaxID=148814 RepID=UPI0006CE7313|nr:hypothetical protein [Apilactobacillus kunkeei]KPN83173.1 hypothetical protein RZ77_08360 [Apilactobacillus kunkeei]